MERFDIALSLQIMVARRSEYTPCNQYIPCNQYTMFKVLAGWLAKVRSIVGLMSSATLCQFFCQFDSHNADEWAAKIPYSAIRRHRRRR